MNWKVFGIAAAASIIVPGIVVAVTSYNADAAIANVVCSVLVICSSILLGEIVFYGLKKAVGRRIGQVTRVISALISAPAAYVVGWIVVVFIGLPIAEGLAHHWYGDSPVFLGAGVAGVAGFAYGCGIGQRLSD